MVNQYKYLGLTVDHQFSVATSIRDREKARGDSSLHVATSPVLPSISSTGEVDGGRDPPALLCIARSKAPKGSENRSAVRNSMLVQEMGMECLTARAMAQRVRGWYKFAKLNTWVAELTKTVSPAVKSWTWQTQQILDKVEVLRPQERVYT